jgi:hypothetical protein
MTKQGLLRALTLACGLLVFQGSKVHTAAVEDRGNVPR